MKGRCLINICKRPRRKEGAAEDKLLQKFDNFMDEFLVCRIAAGQRMQGDCLNPIGLESKKVTIGAVNIDYNKPLPS